LIVGQGTGAKLAAHLFNETWRLIDKPDRTVEEDAVMMHSAHASRSARLHHQAASELVRLVQDSEERGILESDLKSIAL
jgi:hypothetical protein